MIWELLPAPVVGGQVYRLSPISTDEWAVRKLLFRWKTSAMWPQQAVLAAEEKTTREKILVQLWTSNVRDEFDLAKSIQTNAAFSLMP